MGDFDIASTQTNQSFLELLKRRKALGLTDSDDEDDNVILKNTPKHKSKKIKTSQTDNKAEKPSPSSSSLSSSLSSTSSDPAASSSSSSSLSTQQQPQQQPQQPLSSSNVNPYLVSDIEFDTDLISTPPPRFQDSKYNTQSSTSIIDLSDEDEDDAYLLSDIGIEDLDPDLAALTHTVPDLPAQPEKIVVKLQYTHNYSFENLSESAKKSIQFLEKAIKFKVMDNIEFRILLTNFCASKKFLKMEDVYLTYNGDIVFLSGTPASVGMSPAGANKMEVYPKKCYESMLTEKEEQKQKERMRHLQAIENKDGLFSDDEDGNLVLNEAASAVDAVPEEERMRLNLRTDNNKMIAFRVKHTTTLNELAEAFKQRANVSGQVKLSFEGETLSLDQTIEETELEDQDIVEVIIK